MNKVLRVLFLISLAIFLIPIWFIPLRSIMGAWPYPSILPEDWNYSFWTLLFSGGDLSKSLFSSLILSLSVALFATLGGFLLSRSIFGGEKDKSQSLLIFAYLPFLISPVLYAACLYFFFVKFELSASWPGVFIAQIFIALPYSLILWSGFWTKRTRDLEQQSRSLGASSLQTFKKVILPYAGGLLFVCFFQCFIISWFEFGLSQMIGVGQVKTLTILVYQFVQSANPAQAATAAALLLLPPIILLFAQKELLFPESGIFERN